jgi:hypothetical protein
MGVQRNRKNWLPSTASKTAGAEAATSVNGPSGVGPVWSTCPGAQAIPIRVTAPGNQAMTSLPGGSEVPALVDPVAIVNPGLNEETGSAEGFGGSSSPATDRAPKAPTSSSRAGKVVQGNVRWRGFESRVIDAFFAHPR